METRDVAALKTSRVAALSTDQVNKGLTTDQVAAMTTAQVRCAFHGSKSVWGLQPIKSSSG